MDQLSREVAALEEELRVGGNVSEVEELLRRGALTAQRLDQLSAIADRLASRVRAGVIAGCLERLGVNPS
jgi:hypothetical protein